MELSARPDVILTHESDLDGFVAGHLLQRLARKKFGTDVRLEAWNSQAWRQRALRETTAWVCDFTFESRLDRPGWCIVDHHPTLARPSAAHLLHDPSRCAASLCYQLCQTEALGNPTLDRLVHLTNVGDLFLEADPEFDNAQDYAALLKTYGFWNLSRLIDAQLEALLDHPLLEVIRTRRRIEDPIGLAWSRSRIVPLSPEVGWVDIAVGNSNLIVNQLLRDPQCPFQVLLTMPRRTASGVVVSLRSRNGGALDLARKLQGGGHPNAAGATLPRGIQGFPEAADYIRQILRPAPLVGEALDGALGGLSLDLPARA